MTNLQLNVTSSKSVETYSAIALSVIIGSALPVVANASGYQKSLYQVDSASPTTHFELVRFPSRSDEKELLPDLPEKHKIKARVGYVKSIGFSKELFD